MSVSTIVGIVLVLVALVDVGLGWFVILPRTPESNRPVLMLALGLGAVITFLLGVVFLLGLIRLGEPA